MQKRSLETRAHILNSALECFARNGYDATGVAEICTAAGVSKGAFYHHFTSKQAVFLALLQDWLQTIDAIMDANRLKATSTPEALRQMSEMMTGVFIQAKGQLPLFLEFWLQASHDPEVWRALLEPYQRYTAYFTRLIQEGIAEASIKPVNADEAARAIVSLALGLLLQGLLDSDGADWGKVTQQSINYLLRGIEQ